MLLMFLIMIFEEQWGTGTEVNAETCLPVVTTCDLAIDRWFFKKTGSMTG